MNTMKKQTKQLLLLGGVVVICAALYLGLSLWNRQAETDETVYLTQLEDVTSLSFYNGAETLSFSLSDGVWQWDGDSAFPADQSALTSLADAAGQLAAVRIFETPESADSYGLDAPAYEITLSDSAGNQETVLIGNSVDSAYNYAQVEGKTTVYTISSTLADDLNVELMDLAQVETFPDLSEDNMETIAIQRDGQTLTLAKRTSTETDEDSGETVSSYTWSLDGQDIDADNDVLSGMLSSLSYLYFSSCYDYRSDAEEQAACGLDDPVTITVTCSDGSAMKLEIGGATDDGSYYYAVLNGSDAIHRINESIVEDLLSATADSLLAADTETEEAAS